VLFLPFAKFWHHEGFSADHHAILLYIIIITDAIDGIHCVQECLLEVKTTLGKGSRGCVVGIHVKLPCKPVNLMAAKIPRSNNDARLKLLNEALAGSALHHEHLCKVVGWLHTRENGRSCRPWLLMEMADFRPLRHAKVMSHP
jgi:hypothetical protein